jgi:cysteine dioxygenase
MPAADRTLDELVSSLQKLAAEEFTHERLDDLLGGRPFRDATWRPRMRFREDKYARHLIHRTELFEVMLLCWQPGQLSPVHNHQGNSGWVRVLRGRMEETHFSPPDWVVAGVPMPNGSFDIDDEGVGHGIALKRGQELVHVAGPAVCSVDRKRPIHQLGNPRRHADDEPAVTLHVYSRPHGSCLTFDVERATCRRIDLKYDTVPSAQTA